jgi:hypothetical protein
MAEETYVVERCDWGGRRDGVYERYSNTDTFEAYNSVY